MECMCVGGVVTIWPLKQVVIITENLLKTKLLKTNPNPNPHPKPITLMVWYGMVWYGIVQFSDPLDTV